MYSSCNIQYCMHSKAVIPYSTTSSTKHQDSQIKETIVYITPNFHGHKVVPFTIMNYLAPPTKSGNSFSSKNITLPKRWECHIILHFIGTSSEHILYTWPSKQCISFFFFFCENFISSTWSDQAILFRITSRSICMNHDFTDNGMYSDYSQLIFEWLLYHI